MLQTSSQHIVELDFGIYYTYTRPDRARWSGPAPGCEAVGELGGAASGRRLGRCFPNGNDGMKRG